MLFPANVLASAEKNKSQQREILHCLL